MSEYIRRGSYYSIHDYQKLMCLRADLLIKNNILTEKVSMLIDELSIYAKDFKSNCELYNTTCDKTVLKAIIDVFEVSSKLTIYLAEQIYDALHKQFDDESATV